MTPRQTIRYLFAREDGPANHLLARWIFLRCLGGIYFSAFVALLFQAKGMVGTWGILPAGEYLTLVRKLGWLRFWYAPTLLWLNSSNHMLMAIVWAGLIASVLVMLNVLPRWSLVVCFVCFLSFIGVSQDFGEYQSDGMLLEAGFLALFIAPAGVRSGLARRNLPVRAAMFLLLWEWFRIYFQSGAVKLLSGDKSWRNLTAMYEYYQNGPLPTWVGWYLQHLPHWFQKATAGATLVMELFLVFLAFLPRCWRIACFWLVTIWQAGVILTANYAFLNYLVLVLGFLLLDDTYLAHFVPASWRRELHPETQKATLVHEEPAAVRHSLALRPAIRTGVAAVCLTLVGYVSVLVVVQMFSRTIPLPTFPQAILEPFRIANSHGLFANMTPHRCEIEFQGSNDRTNWTPYPFRFKPQDVHERPGIYAPYQPRFDWNLWFASLGAWEQSPIVPLTETKLLSGDQDVLRLFRGDPFAGHPPKYVRAVLYQYWFSTPQQKKQQGIWWTRQLLGTYAPTVQKMPDGRFVEIELPVVDGPPQ